MKTKNILSLVSNEQINKSRIKRLARLCVFSTDDESIEKIYVEIIKMRAPKGDKDYKFKDTHFYYFVLTRMPGKVIYFEAYEDHKTNPVILYLVVEKLQKKSLEASVQCIHELCFLAEKYFNENNADSYSHAVNIVIKIYENNEWYTPFGFLDLFEEYRTPLYEIADMESSASDNNLNDGELI